MGEGSNVTSRSEWRRGRTGVVTGRRAVYRRRRVGREEPVAAGREGGAGGGGVGRSGAGVGGGRSVGEGFGVRI